MQLFVSSGKLMILMKIHLEENFPFRTIFAANLQQNDAADELACWRMSIGFRFSTFLQMFLLWRMVNFVSFRRKGTRRLQQVQAIDFAALPLTVLYCACMQARASGSLHCKL